MICKAITTEQKIEEITHLIQLTNIDQVAKRDTLRTARAKLEKRRDAEFINYLKSKDIR